MIKPVKDILFPELSYQITGLCFGIHNGLGRSRSEKSYADALEIALQKAQIPFKREASLTVSFEGEAERRNIPDFIAAKLRLGLIINFRQHYLTPKRIVYICGFVL